MQVHERDGPAFCGCHAAWDGVARKVAVQGHEQPSLSHGAPLRERARRVPSTKSSDLCRILWGLTISFLGAQVSMPSWIIGQPAIRRSHLYTPPVASCRPKCPTLPNADRNFDTPSRKDQVLLVAGGQAGATTIAGAQGRSAVPPIRWH